MLLVAAKEHAKDRRILDNIHLVLISLICYIMSVEWEESRNQIYVAFNVRTNTSFFNIVRNLSRSKVKH